MRRIASLDALVELAGQEIAVGDWLEVTQERIDLFADATGDHQWIHTDPERASRDTPFGGTIAHGFLTLSLMPKLMESAIHIDGVGMGINYGCNKVRFPAPLRAGSRVRARVALQTVDEMKDCLQIVWGVTIETDAGGKPVCVAEQVVRLYPVPGR